MKFTVQLDYLPDTGRDLDVEVQKALLNVEHNIGPEPLRFTTGPIYAGDGNGAYNTRIGTWEISDDSEAELRELPDEPPAPERRLPYIAKKTSVLQGSDHIAVARSKTMAKRISNALNKHTPNDEGV